MTYNLPGAGEDWLASHQVRARNLSRESENRIHDDSVARGLGFAGSLVPGVEVYAYACHLITRFWGRAWLERGRARCHFFKPVYDDRLVSITARSSDPSRLDLVAASEGMDRATIAAELCLAGPTPDPGQFMERPLPEVRPPADEHTLAPGTWLGSVSLAMTAGLVASYRDAVFETDPLYQGEGLVHPGQILRLCNQILIRNVLLDVWVHKSSVVEIVGLARVGETLSVRGVVVANYEHKGHRLVDLDMIVLADGARPIARVGQTAIYRLRDAG